MYRLIAMGNEPSSLERLRHESLERRHVAQNGTYGFQRLLDGSHDDLALPFGLYRAPFAVLAQQRHNLRHAYLGGLLEEPLVTVDALRRSHGHDKPVRDVELPGRRRQYTHGATLGQGFGYLAKVHGSAAVRDMQPVALREAQHTHRMCGLLFGKNALRSDKVGRIK